ncbi:MAG TPA: L,D-transpeptidase [Sandaracinaceae bacterium]
MARRAWAPFACALLVAAAVAEVRAQRLPVPGWARSVEVVRPGATIRARPTTEAPRRGTVRVGTRLPLLARVLGEGCPGGEWIHVGPEAFLCETLARYSSLPPGGDEVPFVPEGALTPRTHAFVRTDGTWAYARPADYFRDQYVESLGRGFGLAIVERQEISGIELARTLSGLWVPVSELRFARPSDFAGVELDERRPLASVAWVVREGAPLRDRPGGRVVERAPRLTLLRVAGAQGDHLRLEDGRWIASRDVARPTASAPPEGLADGERWIDVDTRTQTLVAYVGERPVFATAVSTGRAGHATPRGTFRIWVKLAEDDMDDLERDDVVENYSIQAVPWVQYFDGSIALHAAFWHDSFGRPRSHGCVNLSPRDARWIFGFTLPALPVGWDAILSTERAPGTIVRVR